MKVTIEAVEAGAPDGAAPIWRHLMDEIPCAQKPTVQRFRVKSQSTPAGKYSDFIVRVESDDRGEYLHLSADTKPLQEELRKQGEALVAACNADIALKQPAPPRFASKYPHYYRESPYSHVDIYRLLKMFDVTDPCLAHAVKKIICAGLRNKGSIEQDVKEAVVTLERWLDMHREDGGK